jgi:hypothetical protein
MINNDVLLNITSWLAFVMDTQCLLFEEWIEILNIIYMKFQFEKFHYPALWPVAVTNCYSPVQKIPCSSLNILPNSVVIFSVSPFHMTLSLTSNLTMFSNT